MIKKIARKEFTEIWRDGRFRWSALIVFALLAVSLAIGWKNYSTVKREHDAANAESRRTWENQGQRNPHSAAHFGVYAFKPKMPLSLVDTGLDNFTGTNIWVEAHYQNPSRGRPIEDSTALQRFGELTAAGVLQLLMPLIIIFLTFDLFAGERERGTLRQVLSIGIRPRKIVFGKMLGFSAALLLLLVPATMTGVLALSLATTSELLLSSILRFALFCVAYLLYFGVFVGIALTASAIFSNSRTALIVLLGFWIFGCLIVPRFANDLAVRTYPTPSTKDQKEGIDGHNPASDRTKELEQRILTQYGVSRKEDLPVNFNGISLNAGEEHGNQVFDKHWGDLWKTYYSQETTQRMFGVVSPFLPVRSVSMGMAGTDLAQNEHFINAAEQYRRDFNRMLNTYFTENSRTKDGYNYFVNREVWEKSPKFVYEAPSTSWVVSRQVPNFALLVLWCFAALGAGVLAASRMKAY
jgi:ABC-2 type transport system permease protein